MSLYEEMASRTPGVKSSKVFRIGEPGKEIVHAAEELHADQIFIGSRGLNFISKYISYLRPVSVDWTAFSPVVSS